MSEAEAPEPQETHGRPVGLVVLLVIVVVGIAAILWGRLIINPDPEVFFFEAGPVASFTVGEPQWFPSVRLFVIALDDDGARKMVLALDAIAPGTGCTIKLDPDDERGTARNPLERSGSYSDPCSRAVWYLSGDALAGTSSPLRTFRITRPLPEDEQGRPLIEVEVIGRPDPSESDTAP